ncbi:hypothetical protein LNP17_21695 [Klebsiella variicola subsp. variicola]|nr:hypothetical protein [Klebsiella variicola subsp. variicola]
MGIVYAPLLFTRHRAGGGTAGSLSEKGALYRPAGLAYLPAAGHSPLRVQALLDGLSAHIKNLSHLLL